MALSSELKLLFACSGIFFSFSYFAVLQEDVYAKDYGGEKFRYTFLALAVERSINAAIAALGVMLLGPSGTIVPLREIFNSGISQMLAMAASNESLRFVSFPTQVRHARCLRGLAAAARTRPARGAGARQVVQDGAGDGGRHRSRRQVAGVQAHRLHPGARAPTRR